MRAIAVVQAGGKMWVFGEQKEETCQCRINRGGQIIFGEEYEGKKGVKMTPIAFPLPVVHHSTENGEGNDHVNYLLSMLKSLAVSLVRSPVKIGSIFSFHGE